MCRTIRQSAIRDIFVRNGGLNADPEREVSFDRRSERAFVGQSIAHHRSRNVSWVAVVDVVLVFVVRVPPLNRSDMTYTVN